MAFSAPSPSPSASESSSSDSNSFSSSTYSQRPSPNLMSSDLGLDPSDPLNLLLHNTSQSQSQSNSADSSMEDISSSQGGSPPDWSQLSSLWTEANTTNDESMKYPDIMDFNLSSLPFDMDFNPSMSIEPSALHFDPTFSRQNYNYDDSYSLSNDLLSAQFPFTFQSNANGFPGPQQQQHQRRLSVTSSSSSSGASLSPILEPKPAAPIQIATSAEQPKYDDAAEELAQRVRQSAGVLLAVPMGAQIHGHGQAQHISLPATNLQAKLPIPRLARPAISTKSTTAKPAKSASPSSSAASTPPPSTPYSDSIQFASPSGVTDPGNGTDTINGSIPTVGRPKTSHTTIERRYRTNLNARIQSLRMAVPALRVLEDRKGGKGKKDNKEGGGGAVGDTEGDGEVVDVVDERGFVDGVKVARKCSKANVLGKAVEYIRVLKKREHRLKREQSGLKALLGGLVGGPALLREWETEWKERFGGEEKDEVEGGEVDGDGGSDDDEDGDEGEDEEDEGGRKKKKPRVAGGGKKVAEKPMREKKIPSAPVLMQHVQGGEMGGVVVPEKRKRGRPRKVVPPPAPAPAPVFKMEPVGPSTDMDTDHSMSAFVSHPQGQAPLQEATQSQPQQQHPQYLLATFALFSFFNSPLTSSSTYSPSQSAHPHTHTGTVLSSPHAPSPLEVGGGGWGWREFIQAFHLLVSLLVFASIVLPWLPVPLPRLLKRLSFYSMEPSADPKSSREVRAPAVSTAATVTAGDRMALIAALSHARRGTKDEAEGLRAALGVQGLNISLVGLMKRLRWGGKGAGFEQKGLEQRAWVRLGEICVLGGTKATALWTRLQTYWHMRSHISWFTASAADLSTLALIVWPIAGGKGKAEELWGRAKAKVGGSGVREYERLVLESLEVSEAAERLDAQRLEAGRDMDRYTPIGVLACGLVRERVKRHLEVLFVRTVLPGSGDAWEGSEGSGGEAKEEDERRRTVDAARSLGGRVGGLGEVLEKVWKTGSGEDVAVMALSLDDGKGGGEDAIGVEGDIKALLSALVLYRRIFPSSILGSGTGDGCGVSILLSPPPSPSRKNVRLHYALRRALGSAVFDSEGGEEVEGGAGDVVLGLGAALEDARDRVVDMLVECERRGRGC